MSTVNSICVYCASGPGNNPAFMEAARKLGRILAENNIRLVYGGGSVGLMGALAESVLDHGGSVTGVIPDFLVNREHMLLRVQERVITPDMHERKRVMFERADAFVALPGGVGTLEELVEQLTWAQLGRHKKPIMILNIARFWDPLCVLLEQMENLDFIRANLPVKLLVADRVEDILPKLFEAARLVPEAEKQMTPVADERM
ncbi:MAG TPA: TIGR00730 family Rossman fold protein [Xanthobacteraceae bacterium]|nr:TIGR00730 family Rossman fold protein [Xanthobacteraceae bacterium]